MRNDLTQAELMAMLEYRPDAGTFRWRCGHPAPTKMWGKIAGGPNSNKYNQIKINRKNYKAHRLAWLYIYGVWPSKDLDHINGDTLDNRIDNLRECSKNENQYNSKLRADNSTGSKGVYKRSDTGKWRGYFTVGKKRLWLGQFDSFEETKIAVDRARKEAHGEFCRL